MLKYSVIWSQDHLGTSCPASSPTPHVVSAPHMFPALFPTCLDLPVSTRYPDSSSLAYLISYLGMVQMVAGIWPSLVPVCCGVTAEVAFLESSCVAQWNKSKEKVQTMKKVRGQRIFDHPDNVLIAWKKVVEDMVSERLSFQKSKQQQKIGHQTEWVLYLFLSASSSVMLRSL